jgi:hypothetical protein
VSHPVMFFFLCRREERKGKRLLQLGYCTIPDLWIQVFVQQPECCWPTWQARQRASWRSARESEGQLQMSGAETPSMASCGRGRIYVNQCP